MSVAFDAPGTGREQLLSACAAAALTSTEIENLIEVYRTIGMLEPELERKRSAFARMSELIGMRSSETVARLERERGLRAP